MTQVEGYVYNILYVFLYNLQVDLLLDSTILKSVYSKKKKRKRFNTMSNMGFEPTMLKLRVHGESGHPW